MQVHKTTKSSNNQKDAAASSVKKNKPFFSAVSVPLVESDIAVSDEGCYEAEADKLANNAMRAPAVGKRQAAPAVSVVGSSSAGRHIPLKSNRAGNAANISAQIARSKGESMDAETRDFMESRLGARFDDVNIHDDTSAHNAASSIRAKAFAYGRHIFFNKGMYQPDTDGGRHLLAHELAHTMQQNGGFKIIQKKTQHSAADFDEIKGAFKTPALEHIFQLHRKANPANKKVAALAGSLSAVYSKTPAGLWEEARRAAEAAVIPSQQNELDLLFDIYKYSGKYTDAKNLAKAKKYKPLKTAFYNPDFYKEVLKGDLDWLPAHPILQPFFPDDFVSTFQAYLYNPYATVPALPKEERLNKQIENLISQSSNSPVLLDNETSLIALEAFSFLDDFRKALMGKFDNRHQAGESAASGRIRIANALTQDGLNELSKKNFPDESFALLKFAFPTIRKIVNNALAFWNNMDSAITLLLKGNKMAAKSISSIFKTYTKEFAKYQKPLETAALTFLELTPAGNIPGKHQFEVQRKRTSQQLLVLAADAGKELAALQGGKTKATDEKLADSYGLFITFISAAQYFTADNENYKPSHGDYSNAQKLNRYGFAKRISEIGLLLNFSKLRQIGNEVLNPSGSTLFGGLQQEISIAFDGDLKATREALSPQQVLSEFNKEMGAAIEHSAYIAGLLQIFIKNRLIEEETELLKKEFENYQNNIIEKIDDYRPIQQRVNDKIKRNALSVNSIIPVRYHIKTLYYTIPASKAGTLADSFYAYTLVKAFLADKFPDQTTFFPNVNEDRVDIDGVRIWAISNTGFQNFSAAMRKLFPDIITEEVGRNNFITAYTMLLNRLLAEEQKLKVKPAPKDAILSGMLKKAGHDLIETPQTTLFALRRKAMSDNRRALNKLLIGPLWDDFQEGTAHIKTWDNPIKAINAMVELAGDHPLMLDKIYQHELQLQITTDLLELGPLIYKRLFKQGTFNAQTNRIDIIVKLTPQVAGALSLEKEVEKNRDSLNPDFEPAEHADRVATLKTLQEGLVDILHGVYESQETELVDLNTGKVLNRVYKGEWLETNASLTELQDRNSNIPFKQKETIAYNGKRYTLLEINQNFHYKPAVELDDSHVSWGRDLIDDINPSVLILGSTPIARKERRGHNLLFKYSVISSKLEDTKIVEVRDDPAGDDRLKEIKAIIAINSNIRNLETLADVLETGSAWIATPFYFIPGLGEAVLAGDIVVGVLQFMTSPEFEILKRILNGEGPDLLEESFNQVKSLFDPGVLWDKLLDENFELPTFIDPKPKEADTNNFNKKSDGKLKKFLYSIIRFGKKLLNGLSGLKSLFNYTLKKIHYFILNRPFLAGAISFVVEHFQTFIEAFKTLDKDEQDKPEDPNLFVSGVNEMLGNLTELEIPLNLIPLDVIIDFVVRIALKSLKGPKGIIAGSVKGLLEKAGIYDKVLTLVGKKMSGTWIDPNKYINQLINDKLQPLVQKAGTGMAEEITGVLQNIPGFEGVKMPEAPDIKTFKDSKDSYEDEDVPETNPFPSSDFKITDTPAIPANPTGGTPLSVSQSVKFAGQYGQDFSHVRIHSDGVANRATHESGALALTSGSHIYLSSGLSSSNFSNDNILKHELGHVLQQTGPRHISASHSSAPVDGRPGKGIVYDQQKEREADNFANGSAGISFPGGGNSVGVFPVLSGSVFKLLEQITKDPDSKLKLHATDAPLSEADKAISRNLPAIVAAALEKMTISKNLAPGLDLIKEYLKKHPWSSKSADFLKLVEVSKIPKKIGHITTDENDWKLKVAHLELAMEQYIAIATGILIDIEFNDGLGSFKKFNIDNIFLENVSDDSIYRLLITNTFDTYRSRGLRTNYSTSKSQDYLTAARNTIKELMPKKVFSGSNFKFTNTLARAIEFSVNAKSGVIHTGERNDPIEIRWTKTGHHTPITLEPLLSDFPSPHLITAHMQGRTKLEVSPSQKNSFPTQTERHGNKDYYTVEIGINPEFMYKKDKVIQRTHSGERGMEGKFKTLLEHHGYKWSGYSPDHIQDLGFGDEKVLDVINNFWPLESANLNEQNANRVYRQRVMYKDGKEIKENTVLNLYDKWFIIKSIGGF